MVTTYPHIQREFQWEDIIIQSCCKRLWFSNTLNTKTFFNKTISWKSSIVTHIAQKITKVKFNTWKVYMTKKGKSRGKRNSKSMMNLWACSKFKSWLRNWERKASRNMRNRLSRGERWRIRQQSTGRELQEIMKNLILTKKITSYRGLGNLNHCPLKRNFRDAMKCEKSKVESSKNTCRKKGKRKTARWNQSCKTCRVSKMVRLQVA